MASQAAGELVAGYVTGQDLPGYAEAFSPGRYARPDYAARLPDLERSGGQL